MVSTMIKPKLQYYALGNDITAFSTTRQGGYSKGCYGEFNINSYCGDEEDTIRKNREALCTLLGIDDNCLIMPHQVHLTEMITIDDAFFRLLLPTVFLYCFMMLSIVLCVPFMQGGEVP